MLDTLMVSDWVVYSKSCITDTETVVDYLGRYRHRIALSYRRILAFQDGRVDLMYLRIPASDFWPTTVGASAWGRPEKPSQSTSRHRTRLAKLLSTPTQAMSRDAVLTAEAGDCG